MTGYTRNDTANNIADGNIINASDLDGEFDAIQSAFDATTGHAHDGTSGGGAPIEVVGPTQDVVVTGTVVRPKTDNTLDLGTSTLEFKDLYLDGTAKIDTLTVDENATVAGTLGVTGNTTASNITASGTVTYGSLSDGAITITAFVDEDDMVSNSATLVPTQQSVKAYVDAQVTAQDLDFQADTGGALNIDLDSEVLTIAGGTGISTSGLGNTVTIDIDSTVATLTGTQTLTNKTLTSPDINGGTVDGATIATSDITVGTGKTLNVSAGTLTLADNQISGDKVEGGTINAITINTLGSTTGNITNVNATTVDTTNLEVTSLKAKDGTAAGSIADVTGVVTLASSVLTTADINGGTIDGTTIATSNITVGAGKTLDVSAGTLTLTDNQISGDKIEGGTINAITINTLTSTTVNTTTVDTTNIEVTNIKAKDGTASATIADATGVMTIGSSVLTTADINGGTVDGTTIGGSSAAAGTFTTATATTGNITTVNATTVDTTNLEVTTLKAKDGTSAGSIADATGVVTLASSVLTTTDINGGTIDGTVIGGTTPAAVTGTTITGTSFVTTGDMTFGDNDKAIFGAGSDLQIYHDGSNSYIFEQGTGELIIQTNGTTIDLRATGAEYMARFYQNAQVELYYDSSKKLATTSTGVDVTGSISADGLTVDGSSTFNTSGTTFNTSGTGILNYNYIGANKGGVTTDGINVYQNAVANMYFNVNSANRMVIEGSGNVGIATNSPQTSLHIGTANNKSIRLDTASNNATFFSGWQDAAQLGVNRDPASGVFTDGTKAAATIAVVGEANNSYIVFNTTGTNNTAPPERMRIDSSGRVGIGTSSPSSALTVRSTDATIRLEDSDLPSGAYGLLRAYDGGMSLEADASSVQSNSYIRFAVDNSERMRLDSSGNLLVGTTSASGKVRVKSDTSQGGDSTALTLHQGNFNNGGTTLIKMGTEGSGWSKGAIGFMRTGDYDKGALIFCTEGSSNTTDVSSSNERMRIDSSGNLLVGKTTSDFSTVGLEWNNGGQLRNVRNGASVAWFNRLTSDGAIVDFGKDGTVVGSIGSYSGVRPYFARPGKSGITIGGGNAITPSTDAGADYDNAVDLGDAAARFRNLYLSGGVYLGGTGAANLLDDYEEGTWTPSFVLGATGASYTNQYGRYIKIGDMVHCWFILSGSWTATADDMRVGTLPFTRANSSTWTSAGWITGTGFSGASGLTLIPGNNAYVYAAKADSSGTVKLNTGSGIYMEGSFSYSTYN